MTKAKVKGTTEEDLRLAIADLDVLAKKPKLIPLRDSIRRAEAKIRAALEAGYSYAEICQVLERRTIQIAPGTLKQYLQDLAKEKEKEAALEPLPTATTSSTDPIQPVPAGENELPIDEKKLGSNLDITVAAKTNESENLLDINDSLNLDGAGTDEGDQQQQPGSRSTLELVRSRRRSTQQGQLAQQKTPPESAIEQKQSEGWEGATENIFSGSLGEVDVS